MSDSAHTFLIVSSSISCHIYDDKLPSRGITSPQYSMAQRARRKALDIFRRYDKELSTTAYGGAGEAVSQGREHVKLVPLVGPIVRSPVNALSSFTIFPTGSDRAWSDFMHMDAARKEFIEWLRGHDYEDGSNPFYWVEVELSHYGRNHRHAAYCDLLLTEA